MARCRHYDNNAAPPPSSLPSVNGGGAARGDRRTKRPRACEEDDDCIGRLPDDVLIAIVSRLTIRDAVWRHLWKHAPRISLRPSHLVGDVAGIPSALRDNVARLAAAASSVLRHHSGAGLDRLVLALPLSPSTHGAVLDQSVEFAASAGARELHLSLAGGDHVEQHYDFPHWRFAGGQLRRLVLSDVGLEHQRGLDGLAQLTQLDLTRHPRRLRGPHRPRAQGVPPARPRGRLTGRPALESIAIESTTLLEFAYRGHKVGITYRHAPAVVRLIVMLVPASASECPLDCVASGAALPKLKQLFLQFPSPLQIQQLQLHHGRRFERLSQIVLFFKTPWREREHVASVASLLVAAPSVKELRVEAYSDLPAVPPQKKQTIQWPRHCSPKKLESIVLGGFSGEPELMELAFFLSQKSPAIRTLTVNALGEILTMKRLGLLGAGANNNNAIDDARRELDRFFDDIVDVKNFPALRDLFPAARELSDEELLAGRLP
ncbi:hypothetical protein HU200_010378 [Digitaria exilis]|uniref:F-box domain-containing protein n=1 Tax=Digitaria exilis TaxID=1010633 RepID=A0A835KRQ8_9POAL|nr:hypothetical protein HU200_010378 [Digitaria exilis]